MERKHTFSGWTEGAVLRWREQMQVAVASVMRRLGRTQFRPDDFAIEQLEVTLTGLSPTFDGYRLAQISDLHMGTWMNGPRLHGVAALVNQQQPDLIAITGDFISYSLHQIESELHSGLRRFKAPDGVVAVLGNHDHWFDAAGVRRILQMSGVRELANDVLTLDRKGEMLHVAGVDDVIVGAERLEQVLAQLPPEGAAILLAHEPDFATTSAASGRFGLQLSGHSHGGQILVGPFGPVRGEMFRKYPLGRYQVGSMAHYTNRGLGTSLLRLRINCPPEITVITLRSDIR